MTDTINIVFLTNVKLTFIAKSIETVVLTLEVWANGNFSNLTFENI